MEKKTVWFSAFRRVVPADYEQWLETLALQGWNIDRVGQTSSMKMTFTKTNPMQYRYVFDLNAFPNKDYFNTYEQFGWECIGHMASCYIWRREYTGARPESFSDMESLIKRNKRVRTVLLICLAMLLLGLAAVVFGFGVSMYVGDWEDCIELAVTFALLCGMTAYLWWAAGKIRKNMER